MRTRTSSLRTCLITAIAMLAVLVAPSARAATICPNLITSCGCVITAAGDYKVTAALNLTPDISVCLQVDAPGVKLDLGGNSVSGGPLRFSGPSTIGVELTRRGAKTIVVGGGSIVSKFNQALEIEGSGSVISSLKVHGNYGGGIHLFNVHDVQLTNFDASNNGDVGLSLYQSSGNQISGFTANGNTSNGVHIMNASDANRILDFQADSNGNVGVLVAPSMCPPPQVKGLPPCPKRGGRGNYLVGGDASGNRFGISVDDRTSASMIIGNSATMNKQVDLEDNSPNCDHNLWFGNTFGTASPSTCIH